MTMTPADLNGHDGPVSGGLASDWRISRSVKNACAPCHGDRGLSGDRSGGTWDGFALRQRATSDCWVDKRPMPR